MPADLEEATPRDAENNDQNPAARPASWDRYQVLRWLVVVAFLAMGGLLLRYVYSQAELQANKNNATSNLAANIKTALMIYAGDNQDYFPDKKTFNHEDEPANSNAAFRKLIASGYVAAEWPFVVKGGAAKADGDISTLGRTLSKGENYYALAKGLRINSDQKLPLVWEAPLSGNWDPIWDSSRKRNQWGSTWSDGTVMVMTVGGSVHPMKIEPVAGGKKGLSRLAPTEAGKNLFQLYPNGDSLGPEW